MSQFSEKLRNQTKEIALKTIKLTRNFPNNVEAWTISKQLIRSCIAVEELDESILWLEFTDKLELAKTEQISPIVNEMKELLAILTTSKSTLNQKLFPDK